MHPHREQNTDGNDTEQAWGHPAGSYSTYSHQPRRLPPTNPTSLASSDPNQSLSISPPHHMNIARVPYELPDPTAQPYEGITGQPGNSMHFSSNPPAAPSDFWSNTSYRTGVHPSHYNPTRGSHVAPSHDAYRYEQAFPISSLHSRDATTPEGWMGEDESRRPTITQQTFNDNLRRGRPDHSLDTPPISHQYTPRDSSKDRYPGHHARGNSVTDDPRFSNIRSIRQSQGPYQQTRRGLRPSSLAHPGDEFQSGQYSTRPNERSLSPAGGIAIPRVPAMDNFGVQVNPQDGPYYPLRDNSPFSRSLPARSPRYDWSPEHTSATPAPTEGSADPAQSDQDEYDPRASTSTSPQMSMSTSTSSSTSTASRWARFRVPADIYTDPFDPVRHELYHQIRQEDWFLNQAQERPISAFEASRIPGSIPGESVLLAFYDRVTDAHGKTVMRCTICVKTNPTAQLYPRPDRARVHMRHHFEIRPIPCNGKCNTPHCTQRFFTLGDLGAHVTGKTEPLATCDYCRKTMRAKNFKRHITHFCHRAPAELRSKSRA